MRNTKNILNKSNKIIKQCTATKKLKFYLVDIYIYIYKSHNIIKNN